MKLSWLIQVWAHNQHKHIYDMTIWCNAQCKRERVRESGSNANTEICFEIRAHSSTSPPSHRRISTNLSTLDFPHREPSLRIWGKYNREYTTPLSTKYNLSLEASHKHKSPLHLEDRHLAKQWSTSQMRDRALSHTITITSHLRDSNTTSTITSH